MSTELLVANPPPPSLRSYLSFVQRWSGLHLVTYRQRGSSSQTCVYASPTLMYFVLMVQYIFSFLELVRLERRAKKTLSKFGSSSLRPRAHTVMISVSLRSELENTHNSKVRARLLLEHSVELSLANHTHFLREIQISSETWVSSLLCTSRELLAPALEIHRRGFPALP